MTDCSTCFGYGLWAIGDPVPMGPMDARDGMATKPCPECGADYSHTRRDTHPGLSLVDLISGMSDAQIKELYRRFDTVRRD